jgi:hypothetical protein
LSVFKIPKWGFKKLIDSEGISYGRGKTMKMLGGHCLVNWQKYTRPKGLGGLGIKELEKFSRALRLRWL